MRTSLLAGALLLLVPALAHAQPAPYRHWRTIETPHFHVHAPAGLEREGRVAGAAAERAYAQLARELVAPRGPIDLVVSDDADFSNGFATPVPSNRIVVFATPPVEAGGLGLSEDWLALVVTHELTHIFHLDRSKGIWGRGQRIFGRFPLLFPNIWSPSWFTEGLAVYYESRLTRGGRLESAEHRHTALAAAAEDALPRLGDLSLSSPRFPGGSGTYVYGSLFLEHLARAHGDSAIPRLVERQSAELVPLLQNRASRHVLGNDFAGAFGDWRDSLRRSGDVARLATPGWRELTTHGWYALNPRWLNDTTIVYTGDDGRETHAAYTVTTSGVRRRLGRRSGSGANVPLRDGGLLFAQLEYAGPDEVRSDLYVERQGRVTRLTHGARLIEPDVGVGGRIVAVEVGAARTSLVLLDSAGGGRQPLREAGPDETWSEPRWSPDGGRVAAIHRLHGRQHSVEVIDVRTGTSCAFARDTALLSSPSWSSDGTVVFASERSGLPRLRTASACGGADGYHIGIVDGTAPAAPSAALALAPSLPDTQALASGEYRAYSALPSLLPRFWFPLFVETPGGGTGFGAVTAGGDVVGRHSYAADVAIDTRGRYSTGDLLYRYAGLRQPVLDLALVQDWSDRGFLIDAAAARIGSLYRITRDLSAVATFVRPRVQTFSALSAGVGVERRRYLTEPAPLLAQLDPVFSTDRVYPRLFVNASFSNAQRPRLAISNEDGVALSLSARERWLSGETGRTASLIVIGSAAGYRSLPFAGFAHHVLALRGAAGRADSRTATSLEVGGTSGGLLDVAPGLSLGEGRRTFGVRGFPAASIYGTQAVAGTLEYRAPAVLVGRGLSRLPAFLDRTSLTLFADAGSASCPVAPVNPGTCSPDPVLGRTIASVGAEAGVSVALFQWDAASLFRVGVAVPVAGRDAVSAAVSPVPASSVYLAVGRAF